MAKRILSISLIEDDFQYLEVEKQPAGFFPHPPPNVITDESLMSACRKADEIFINTLFPITLYEWDLFPKVAKQYLESLVSQSAQEKPGITPPVQVRFQTIKETVDAGVTKWQIAYAAIESDNITSLWERFENFSRKIKIITPLPGAVASTIAHVDHPTEDFVLVWVGETSSVVSVSDPAGLIKVSRCIPLGLSKRDSSDDPDSHQQFSRDLDEEISMTLTFFKQQFRASVPRALYLVGNSRLQDIFQRYPLSGGEFDIHFALSESPVQAMSDREVNENINLIGNLYLTGAFNFIPREATVERKVLMGFGVAYAALVIAIFLTAFWGFSLTKLKSDKMDTFNNQFSRFQDLKKQVEVLQSDVARLKPFEGWKVFYENTFQNRPKWNMFLSELGLLIPPTIVLEDLQVLPLKGSGVHGRNVRMAGKIKADNWQEGLSMLREFGGKLQSSSFFEVTNVQYTPEAMTTGTKTFDFRIAFTLLNEESAHES